jgi:predicted transcriptional regulator
LAPGAAPNLLGGDQTLERTIRAAAELEDPFSVSQLVDKMDISPQAANNRLRQLTRVGALQRERVNPAHGGREFRYRVPVAA